MMWRITFIVVVCVILFLDSTSGRHSHSHKHRKHRDETHQASIDEKLALEHSVRVGETCTCNQPKVHVVQVSDHYPGRSYLPHCTVLHRCGKHSGCCATDELKCVASEKQRVVLHFFSIKMMDNGQPPEKKIAKLTFTNHTKCGCVPVDPTFPAHSLIYSENGLVLRSGAERKCTSTPPIRVWHLIEAPPCNPTDDLFTQFSSAPRDISVKKRCGLVY